MSVRKQIAWPWILGAALAVLPLATCQATEESGTEATAAPESETAATADAEAAPRVVITIERGNRKVTVGGREYGRGVHRPSSVNWDSAPPGRRALGVGPGNSSRVISMGSDGLEEIHIDASAETPPATLVFGRYDEIPASSSTASVLPIPGKAAAKWECVWCQGQVLVCGVDPQCEGDAGSDSTGVKN